MWVELVYEPAGQQLSFVDGQYKEIGNAYIDLKMLIINLYDIVTVVVLDLCTVSKVTGHVKNKGKQK